MNCRRRPGASVGSSWKMPRYEERRSSAVPHLPRPSRQRGPDRERLRACVELRGFRSRVDQRGGRYVGARVHGVVAGRICPAFRRGCGKAILFASASTGLPSVPGGRRSAWRGEQTERGPRQIQRRTGRIVMEPAQNPQPRQHDSGSQTSLSVVCRPRTTAATQSASQSEAMPPAAIPAAAARLGYRARRPAPDATQTAPGAIPNIASAPHAPLAGLQQQQRRKRI